MKFSKNNKKRRCIVVLSGGIGNQMFQYAFARAFCLENNYELVIDKFSGFFRDRIYKRKFELDKLNIKQNYSSRYLIFILLLHRCFFNQAAPSSKLSSIFLGYQFIIESDTQKYVDMVKRLNLCSTNWIIGYWQSEKYFKKITDILLDEFKINPPKEKIFLSLKNIYDDPSFETVAVGIRLYEESSDPASHVNNGKLKSILEIQNVINEIISKNKKARFLIFSTSNSSFIAKLVLPDNSVFITSENGYSDTISTLWALSNCQHHIISSGTFYWWGAWLSQRNWRGIQQEIYAANNFFNSDSYPSNWKMF